MNHDALRAVWVSHPDTHKENLMTVMNTVLDEDRAACEKDRWVQVAAVIAVGLLCPPLLWFAAYGRTPLVRGGYSLMAMGTAMMLFAKWLHRTWSRQALPGAADTAFRTPEARARRRASSESVPDRADVVRAGFPGRRAYRHLDLQRAQRERRLSSMGDHRYGMAGELDERFLEGQDAH